MAVYVQFQYEDPIDDMRLGRHIEHDPRSRAYPVQMPTCHTSFLRPVKTVQWTRRAPVFDQGAVGSCTGNAMAGAIGTDSLTRQGNGAADETLALDLYTLATRLDKVPGEYPGQDTGSTGVAVAKAAKVGAYITAYKHAFGIKQALVALQAGPLIVGMSWLTGCDEPGLDGMVQYKGYLRGGHEVELVGCDVKSKQVTFVNSWGGDWGKNGYFKMSWSDFDVALKHGGDVVQPVFA